MPESEVGGMSLSFAELQRVQRSFDEIGSLGPMQERTILRLVSKLGARVIPLCLRSLKKSDADARRAQWACSLLAHLAEAEEHRERVLKALEAMVKEPEVDGPVKLRILALLGELGSEAREWDKGSAVEERSVRELALLLATAPGVAQAGDIVATRFAGKEMLALVETLCTKEPRRVTRLLDELLLRNDIAEHCRRELKRIRAPLRARDQHTVSAPPPGGQPVATVTAGQHASGRRVVVASRKLVRRASRQYRAVCLIVGPDGTLIDGMYRDDFPLGGVEEAILGPLRSQGYQLETRSRGEAFDVIVRAARAARQLGKKLPRAFYLGRDLLGIHDQHAVHLVADDDSEILLDRARELLTAGQAARARPLFERYVAQVPSSPDGSAGLAMCLLALGDASAARPHLRRAAWLEPQNPNHHWNLSAIAHREGRAGGCYLALMDYLDLCGEFDEAPGNTAERRATAERFVAEYERITRLEYPGVDPVEVARADELLFRARQRMETGQYEEVITVLEQALVLVPEHYPALTCLGLALGESGRLDEAEHHLSHALTVRPGFTPAIHALERVRQPAAMPPKRAKTKKRRSSGEMSGVEEGRIR